MGNHIVTGNYGETPTSYLLKNNEGQFQIDIEFEDLGMVTDAVWSDYDGDGWTDLIVTREWNSISILKNNEGKLKKELNFILIYL